MTATRIENVPRYSSTSRNAQLLRANAAHSHTHSSATSGTSQPAEARCFLTIQVWGRVLGACKIIANVSSRESYITLGNRNQLNRRSTYGHAIEVLVDLAHRRIALAGFFFEAGGIDDVDTAAAVANQTLALQCARGSRYRGAARSQHDRKE